LIEIGSKTAEKNSAQTNRQTDRHYENNGHLAVNQQNATGSIRLVKVVVYSCSINTQPGRNIGLQRRLELKEKS